MATERTVLVRLRADAGQFQREMLKARAAVAGVRDEIDTTNDRTAWMAQGFLALAPTLAPLGAAAIPILSGIATQATLAVAAVGTMALAFSGVGDALGALNKYQLDPTTQNLIALQDEMDKLGPDGANFVRFLDDAGEKLSVLKMDAREEMFPGMTEGIEEALTLLPRLRTIVSEIAGGIGQLSIDAGGGLAGPEFAEFFDYLETDARDVLVQMGRTLGNFADGFASMLVAFGPLTAEFSAGLLGMSRSFEEWAEGLESSETFQEFVAYIRESGPKAIDLLASVADAFIQLAEAAAPIGDIALPILTAFFDVVAAIADTPVGSLLILTAALTSMYGRVKALQSITSGGVVGRLTSGVRESTSAAKTSIPTFRQFGLALGYAAHSNDVLKKSMMSGSKIAQDTARNAFLARQQVKDFARESRVAAGSGALLALSMTGVADSAGLGNTVMGAMVGLMTTSGPWGAAIGAAIGATTDLAASFAAMEDNAAAAHAAIKAGDLEAMIATYSRLHKEIEDIGAGEALLGTTLGNIPALWGGDTWLDEMDKQGAAVSDLKSEIDFLKGSLSGNGWDASGLALYYEGLGFTADEARRAAMGVNEFSRAVERSLGILDKQADFDAFEAAIDDARKGFKEFGATLDAGTNAGRQNRENLRGIAESALTASEHLRGMARVDYLRDASVEFVKMAKTLGMGEKAAQRWANRLFMLEDIEASPAVNLDDKEGRRKVKEMLRELGILDGESSIPSVNLMIKDFLKGKVSVEQMMRLLHGMRAEPKIDADNSQAIAAITAARSALNTLPRYIPITLHVSRTGVDAGSGLEFGSGGQPKADGGTVPGRRIPYADKTLILAAPGEEVITNRHGEADRFRADRAAGRIPAYADGGTIGLPPIFTRSGNNDVAREASETARGLKGLRSELKQATAALEKERKQRDALVEKMTSLSSTVSGGLRSELFGETDVWASEYGGSSPAGVMSLLQGDVASAEKMRAAIRELKSKGLTGAALAEVLAQGGVAGAQAFADLSRVELREYADLFNRRNRLLRSVGESAGSAAYGGALRQSRREFRELKQEVVRLRHAVEKNGKNDREDYKQNRESQRRGAGNAARNRRKD